jgi:hypothetical protein
VNVVITLIIDDDLTHTREIKEQLTLRELGNALTELSAKYVLVFDTVQNIIPACSCDLYVTIVDKR